MVEKKIDVLGFENPVQDLVIEIDRLPEPNVNKPLREYRFQGGGNVSTALCAAGRLGLKSAIMGVIGDDMLGETSKADFAYNNVDTSHLEVEKGARTNFCLCVAERDIEGKEFMSKPGDCRLMSPEELDEEFIKSAKVLHIGMKFTPGIKRACDLVHQTGGKVSVDAAYYRPEIYEHYQYYDIFIASEMYYDKLCEDKGFTGYEEALRYVQKQGPDTVIFTIGPDGSRGVCGDKYFEVPAFKVDVVDSTGAGDVFHGAYIYAYLQGWEAEECARFSSGVSAIKCTALGGRTGIPDLATVTKFLNEGVIDDTQSKERALRYRRGFGRE